MRSTLLVEELSRLRELHGNWHMGLTEYGRTNGAAGVIPATLKYVTEFISQDAERE